MLYPIVAFKPIDTVASAQTRYPKNDHQKTRKRNGRVREDAAALFTFLLRALRRPAGIDSERLASGRRLGAAPERDQRRHALAIAPVLVAELRDEIVLLERDADEDVGSGHRREQQVADRHGRRRPERDD